MLRLDVPFPVLTGEKASGTFLIEQVTSLADGRATGEVIPAIAAFVR